MDEQSLGINMISTCQIQQQHKMQNQYYKLRPNISAQEIALVESAKHTLSQSQIIIEKGEYNKKKWTQIFRCILQSNARKLSLFSNDTAIQLMFILTPKFSNLKELYLSCNKIVSIEAIGRLHSPLLQDIVLLTNHITNIQTLRKADFPKLKEINISNNPIKDPTPLIYLSSKKLQEIHVERWPNLPMIGQSKRWTVKLYPPSANLKALSLKSYGRRAERHIDKMIQAKYPVFKAN